MIQSLNGICPIIHPTAFIHKSAVIIGNVIIEEGASIWPQAVLRADDGEIRIGAYSNIQDGTIVHLTNGLSNTCVGRYVTVGHRVILHGCKVGDNSLIGMGSIILDNAIISENSIVGAGALITMKKEFPSNVMIIGSPAKVTRSIDEKELSIINTSWQHYYENAKAYVSTGVIL